MEASHGYGTATVEGQDHWRAAAHVRDIYLRSLSQRYKEAWMWFLLVLSGKNYTTHTALATPSWTDVAQDGPFLLS